MDGKAKPEMYQIVLLTPVTTGLEPLQMTPTTGQGAPLMIMR